MANSHFQQHLSIVVIVVDLVLALRFVVAFVRALRLIRICELERERVQGRQELDAALLLLWVRCLDGLVFSRKTFQKYVFNSKLLFAKILFSVL